MLVEAWLHRAARTRPDAVALRADDGALTYAELHDAATLAAQRLSALGVRPGDRVAIALPARRAFVETLHGCLLLGAPAVPVDLRARPAERRARTDGCVTVVDAPLDGFADAGAPLRDTHDLAAPAIVVHTSGTTSGPRAVAADLRQLAVERARLGRRARRPARRRLAVHAAAVARRRPVDPRAQRDLRDEGRPARALRRRGRRRRARHAGDARLRRPDDARAPARRRPAPPAAPAGRARRRRPDHRDAAAARGGGRACRRSAPTA